MKGRENSSGSNNLGCINFEKWVGYTWKNELLTQKSRVTFHLEEIFDEAELEYNPLHMLERAFCISAFCMRRMIECRLVTDQFSNSLLPIYEIPRQANTEYREHFKSFTGGNFFEKYNFKRRDRVIRSPKYLSNRFLHASVLATISKSDYLPNGLLIASDFQASKCVFHMSIDEFNSIAEAFLADTVFDSVDGIDSETGETYAKRN